MKIDFMELAEAQRSFARYHDYDVLHSASDRLVSEYGIRKCDAMGIVGGMYKLADTIDILTAAGNSVSAKELSVVVTEWAHKGERDLSVQLFEHEARAKQCMSDILKEERRGEFLVEQNGLGLEALVVEDKKMPYEFTAYVDGNYAEEHFCVTHDRISVNEEDV